MKFSNILRRKLDNNLIQVFLPEQITSTFDSVFGANNAKLILQDIVNYFQYDCQTLEPYTSYAIIGPHGSRKESLVFATANASGLPVISVDTSIFTTQDEDDIAEKLALVFKVVEKLKKDYPGVLVMFQNIHQTEEMDNDNLFYLNLVREYRKSEKTFIFALSSQDNWAVPPLVMQEGLFETIIYVDYPDLATREKIFEACIKKENIKLASDVSINRLAKDTYGETYRSIEHIVKDAHLYSVRQNHTEVTQSDFSETIMRLSAGDKNLKMTEKERKLCAYHEAGHVIAGYFSDDEYVLNRVEISPRSQGSLGLTLSDIDENKYSYFKEDFNKNIIVCLGGLAAEEEVFGAHTSGVISDLSMATATAANMVKAYGMDDEFGPRVVLPGITDSWFSLSTAELAIGKLLAKLLEETQEIMKEKRPYLDALANALLEKEVVLGTEIKDIFDKVDAEMHEIEVVSFEADDPWG